MMGGSVVILAVRCATGSIVTISSIAQRWGPMRHGIVCHSAASVMTKFTITRSTSQWPRATMLAKVVELTESWCSRMHDFGPDVDLKGKKVIVRQIGFYPRNATKKQRTFECIEGPGCTEGPSMKRDIKAKWLGGDKTIETISSHSIDQILEEK